MQAVVVVEGVAIVVVAIVVVATAAAAVATAMEYLLALQQLQPSFVVVLSTFVVVPLQH